MSRLHDRAGWDDSARTAGDRIARLLYPEHFDGGPDQTWTSPAEYLEAVGSIVTEAAKAHDDAPQPPPVPAGRTGHQVVLTQRQIASLYGMRKTGRRFVLHVLAVEQPGDHVEIEASGGRRVVLSEFKADGALRKVDL